MFNFNNNKNNNFNHREDYDRSYGQERASDDIFSKPVRAGKRTYFFDVKTTKGNNDYYLTITESKRKTDRDGNFVYDKHKIFLYKEDFEKFQEGLNEVINYIKENCLTEESFEESNFNQPEESQEDTF